MKNKKLFAVSMIIMLIICISLTIISVFVMDVPIIPMVILPIIVVVMVVYYFKNNRRKIWKYIVVSLFTIISVSMSLFGAFFNPYTNSVSFRDVKPFPGYDVSIDKKSAISDLNYMMNKLKKVHPMFINKTPQAVEKRYNQTLKDINNKNSIREIEFYYMVSKILSPLSDAHTSSYIIDQNPHYFKYLWQMRDKGYNLKKVFGMSAEDILKKRNDLFSYEFKDFVLSNIEKNMVSLEGIQKIGFTIGDEVEYTFVDDQGVELTQTYPVNNFISYKEFMAYYKDRHQEKVKQNERPFVSYQINPVKSTAILYLDKCRYNDEYVETLKEMFSQVNETGIKNVVVDLRNNPGGSSLVANEFIRYLDVEQYRVDTFSWRLGPFFYNHKKNEVINKKYKDNTFRGNLFVLTSTDTFSSAMLFAEYIKDNKLGILIGEAPGNAANGYGEVVRFQLPNSRLLLSISSKKFTRANPENQSNLVKTDIPCESENSMEVLYKYIDRINRN